MIFKIRGVELEIEVHQDCCSTLVMKNKRFLRAVLNDLFDCTNGLNTFEIVLEKDCKALNIAKKVMVVNDYYQYDKIFKVLLSEVNKELECCVNTDQDIKNKIEFQLNEIYRLFEFVLTDLDVELTYNDDIQISSLIKLLNFQFDLNVYTKSLDKLYLILDLISKYFSDKLLILINLTSYFEQYEITELIKYCKYKKINLLMIESNESDIIYTDHLYLIDEDLDEFIVT